MNKFKHYNKKKYTISSLSAVIDMRHDTRT